MRALPRPRLPLRAVRRRTRGPIAAVVEYRVGPFIRWRATVSSPAGEFDVRVVVAEDAEGIYLAALTALDELRPGTGRLVEAEHVLREDLVPASILTLRQNPRLLPTKAHLRRPYSRVPPADVRFRKQKAELSPGR